MWHILNPLCVNENGKFWSIKFDLNCSGEVSSELSRVVLELYNGKAPLAPVSLRPHILSNWSALWKPAEWQPYQSCVKLPPMQTQHFLHYCFILKAFKCLNNWKHLLWRIYRNLNVLLTELVKLEKDDQQIQCQFGLKVKNNIGNWVFRVVWS